MTYFTKDIFTNILSYCGETYEDRRDRLWKKIGIRREEIQDDREEGGILLVHIHPTIDGKIVSCRPDGVEIFRESGFPLEEMYDGGDTEDMLITEALVTGVIWEGSPDWWNSGCYEEQLKILDDDYYDLCWTEYFKEVEDREMNFRNLESGHWD